MKSTVFRYGLYASLLILGLSAFSLFILAKSADYSTQEIAGYLTIALSMIFVYFGIRHYRDKVNGGVLRFGEGLKLGILIALIPSICFGLFDILYTQVINPDWSAEYYKHYTDQIRASTPADQVQAKLDKLDKQRELFSSPAMEFLLMFLTVFVIGVIASVISALTLRRSNPAMT